MTRQPDDIGRMAQHFEQMNRQRRRDAVERFVGIALFAFGAISAGAVFLIALSILRGL